MVNWHIDKGFGFIRPNQGGEDVFCHVSDLLDGEGSVQEGDKVRYVEKFDERKGKSRAAEVEVSAGGGSGSRRYRSRSRDRYNKYSRGKDERRGDRRRSGSETGVMLRWQADKGYGFIQPDDGGDDVFCHVTGLVEGEDSVRDGDVVVFTRDFNQRREKDEAINVSIIGSGRGRRDGGGGRDYHRGRDSSRGRDYDREHGRNYDRGRDYTRGERSRDDDRRGGYDEHRRRRDRDYDRH